MQALQEIQIEHNSELGAVVSSRVVANELNRTHKNVIRGLEKILTGSNVSSLIIPSEYKDSKGESRKEYLKTVSLYTCLTFKVTTNSKWHILTNSTRWRMLYKINYLEHIKRH